MSADYEVALMTEADIPGAIDAIQQAFANDPYNKWVYNDRSKFNPIRNRHSLTLRCTWGMAHAQFYVYRTRDPSRVLGVAMWLPPSATATDPHTKRPRVSWRLWVGNWWLWLQQVRMNASFGRGGLNVRRYWIWKERQGEAQREILSNDVDGVYFCNIVAVLPEAQGKGVGRELMRVVLEKADTESRRCYLESSRREPNVHIYEKFGFRLVREMLCEDEGEGVKLYCMIRDPVKEKEAGRAERAERAERTEHGEGAIGEPGEVRVDS